MPYSLENKLIAKEFLKKVRSKTYCEKCGCQPVDFHRKEHETDGNLRVSRMAARGHPIEIIQAEIDRCSALCRSCHMKEDGRLEVLRANCPIHKGMKSEPKPCIICGVPSNPVWKEKCRHCYDAIRRGKLIPLPFK